MSTNQIKRIFQPNIQKYTYSTLHSTREDWLIDCDKPETFIGDKQKTGQSHETRVRLMQKGGKLGRGRIGFFHLYKDKKVFHTPVWKNPDYGKSKIIAMTKKSKIKRKIIDAKHIMEEDKKT